MSPTDRRTRAVLLGIGALAAAGLASARSETTPEQPFPYDPLCRWGRLSDGKGYVIRCLSREEATRLGAPAGGESKPAPSGAAPTSGDPAKAPAASGPEGAAAHVDVVIGPVTADTGAFPEALKSLSKGQTKFEACIADHGGITATEAKVEVRFIVHGRGRAEGVAVKKHSGLSKEAAQCIADVVDRRFVGYPAEEMVGATLLVTVKKRIP